MTQSYSHYKTVMIKAQEFLDKLREEKRLQKQTLGYKRAGYIRKSIDNKVGKENS